MTPIRVLHSDQELVVVNKPASVPVSAKTQDFKRAHKFTNECRMQP